jgi:hypothetical protein
MLTMHLNAVADDLGSILADQVILNEAVGDHIADRNTEFLKPAYKPGDYRDGRAPGQRDEKERSEGIIDPGRCQQPVYSRSPDQKNDRHDEIAYCIITHSH